MSGNGFVLQQLDAFGVAHKYEHGNHIRKSSIRKQNGCFLRMLINLVEMIEIMSRINFCSIAFLRILKLNQSLN